MKSCSLINPFFSEFYSIFRLSDNFCGSRRWKHHVRQAKLFSTIGNVFFVFDKTIAKVKKEVLSLIKSRFLRQMTFNKEERFYFTLGNGKIKHILTDI